MLVNLQGPCTKHHWHFTCSPWKVQYFSNWFLLYEDNLLTLWGRYMCPFSSLASRTIVLPVALSAGLPMCMYWTPRWTVHVHVLLKVLCTCARVGWQFCVGIRPQIHSPTNTLTLLHLLWISLLAWAVSLPCTAVSNHCVHPQIPLCQFCFHQFYLYSCLTMTLHNLANHLLFVLFIDRTVYDYFT